MSVSPSSLVDVLSKNKDKKMLAAKIIETNPKTLSIVPKLIRDQTTPVNDLDKGDFNINRSILEDMHSRVMSVKNNNKNIMKLFPDIELAIQILVSSILSPKKMTDIQLNYKLDQRITVPPAVSSELLDIIKTYINDNYELEEKLPEIVREALFASGAYVQAIIPESSVDDIINTDILPTYSTEEFKTRVDTVIQELTSPVNILGLTKQEEVVIAEKATGEDLAKAMASESFVRITDNVKIMKFGKWKDRINAAVIKNSLKRGGAISQESLEKVGYMDIFRQKSGMITNRNTEFVKRKNETIRKTIGKPMVTRIPTESIIPVFIPGNETEHVGYFVLLDETGKPLNTDVKNTNISQINSLITSNTQAQMTPVQKAYNALVTDSTSGVNINQLFDMYKDVLERQIYSTIKNSLYGSDVDVAEKNDIYFLMFTRALANQRTNLLFIPKELVVYFAFNYNDVGIGRSLLENLSVLSSLRAILLFSKVMAHAKQSIDITKVNISLDPNDPDPEKTIEQIQDSVLKLRQNYFPLGINNPVDLVNWIQRAGLQFSYENNPLLPNVKIDFENVELQHTIPNSDLEEDLRKQTIIALGLPPETIDNGFSPEFATTVVNNNILLSKRVAVYQKTLTKHLNKLLVTLTYNDEDLRTLLRKEIMNRIPHLEKALTENEKALLTKDKAGFIEYYIDHLSEHIFIDFPKPDNTNINNLSAEYDVYKENLDKVIDSVISTETFAADVAGDVSEHIDTIRNVYRHYLLRKWMSENNFYPEVLDLAGSDLENIDGMISSMTEHLSSTMRNSASLLSLMEKFKKAVNSDLAAVTGDGAETAEASTSDSSDTDAGDEGGGGGDDLVNPDDESLSF